MYNNNFIRLKLANKLNMRSLVVGCLISLILSACSSTTPKMHYYALNSLAAVNSVDGSKILVLRPLELAPYLKDKNLHVLQQNNQISISAYHQWIEPLQDGLQRALTADLEKYSQRAVLKRSEIKTGCSELGLRVDVFSPLSDGNVQFSGRWFYYQQQQLVYSKNFSYTKKMQSDGFLASTQLLRELVEQLAKDISAQIKQRGQC